MSITKPTTTYYQQASDRLLFRTLTLGDIDAWMPFFDRDDYQQFIGGDTTLPKRDRSKAWIERQIQRKSEGVYGQLAFIEKTSGKFIGLGGIVQREVNEKEEFEITYSLLPAFWGNGYAREMAKHFMDYAQANIETNSVISMIHPENQPSINLALANGLNLEGETVFMGIPVEVYRHIFT
jgi:RimJ/RimL family protein N-acetyltransferase